MSVRLKRVLWLAGCTALFCLLFIGYFRWIFGRALAEFTWTYNGIEYALLEPRMLGLVLLTPWFLAVLAFSLAALPWQQMLLSVLSRTAFFCLLALALAQPVRTSNTDQVCAVYLADVSDSVSVEAIADAQKIVDAAYDKKREDDVLRVVSFAKRPRVIEGSLGEGDSSATPQLVRHEKEQGKSGGAGAGSNLQAALQLAYGLYPAGCLRRAVLISDGQQTAGNLLAEASRARNHGIRLHAVAYDRPTPAEVAVRELRIPERVKIGETFNIVADVYASRATSATIRLYQGEVLNGLDGVRKVDLKAGTNEVKFQSVVRVAGEVTYALRLDAVKEDQFKENNHFTTTVDVPGRPQVLYVDGTPRYAGPLSRALTAQQFDVDLRPPSGFPVSLSELERYDFLILSDTPKQAVGLRSQELIERYVRDLGGGFLFAGGEQGYGLGGWYRSTVARILPVRMENERRREMPSVAMVLVIDRSGSMTGLPIEMAKKAAKATLGVLAADDLIEVVAFDSRPNRYVKMQPARNRSRIRNLVARIQPGGGTEIFSALDAAYNDLSVTQARKKHVILLTDGKAPSSGIRDLVTAMIAESMTVTTVGLGGDVDEQMLKMIADVGGGRYHPVPDPQSLPRIFTKETEMIARAAAVEEWFPVVQSGYASFLRGIDVRTAPYLHGYVATKMKPRPAVELLQSADTHDPILARWRVGTGWSLAWTSDIKARWAVEWISWRGFERFWGQLVREHMRQKHHRELDMVSEIVDGTLRASVDAFTTDERFDNKLVAKLTVLGPLPGDEKQEIDMRQTAPGRYEAELPLSKYGSFLLRAKHFREQKDGALKPVAISTGQVSNPYPREYASFEPDRDTLARAASVTSGLFNPKNLGIVLDPGDEKIEHRESLWPRLVMSAIFVFLCDLLLRRVRIFDRKFVFRRRQRYVPTG